MPCNSDGTSAVKVGDSPLSDNSLQKLYRLEVREADTEAAVVSLRFRLGQLEDGTFKPIDEDLFVPGAKLEIDLGANSDDTAQRVFQGFVTHIRPHFQRGPGSTSYLEVLGMDHAVLLDAQERIATYPDAADSDAVTEILGRYSITPDCDTTDATYTEDTQLLVQRATDWRFMQYLARRNGFICSFESDSSSVTTGLFKKRPVTDPPQGQLEIQTGNENLVWLDIQYSLTGPVRYTGAAINPVAKTIIRSEGEPVLDPLGTSTLQSDVEDGLTSNGVEEATALLRDPQPLDEAINAEGSGLTDRALMAIEAMGQIDPVKYGTLLRPRRTVLIAVGSSTERFSGNYYVKNVRTVLEDGIISQVFVAERNSTDGQDSAPWGATGGGSLLGGI